MPNGGSLPGSNRVGSSSPERANSFEIPSQTADGGPYEDEVPRASPAGPMIGERPSDPTRNRSSRSVGETGRPGKTSPLSPREGAGREEHESSAPTRLAERSQRRAEGSYGVPRTGLSTIAADTGVVVGPNSPKFWAANGKSGDGDAKVCSVWRRQHDSPTPCSSTKRVRANRKPPPNSRWGGMGRRKRRPSRRPDLGGVAPSRR